MTPNALKALGLLAIIALVGSVAYYTGYSIRASALLAVTLLFGAAMVLFCFLALVSIVRPAPRTKPLRHGITADGFVKTSEVISLSDYRIK